MGVETALIAMTALAAAGTANSVIQGNKAAANQRHANDVAKQQAEKTAKDAEIATNRANAKTPDTGAALSQAQQDALAGGGSTFLTGAQGVDPNALSLGKTTLLGG